MEGERSAEDNHAVKEVVACCPNCSGYVQRAARPAAKVGTVRMPCSIDWPIDGDDPKRSEGGIPKNADGKNQASEDARRMLCKRHLGSKRANMFKTRRHYHPYRTGRSHGAEDNNVQNREVLYQNERMKMIFHGPSIPHGPKS